MSQREMHPAGYFRAEILDHGFSESTGGTPQFSVQFQTEHGQMRGFFALSDNAIEHTIKKIRAMGYAGDDLADLEDGSVLRGAFCIIQVTHDTYNGTVSPKVGWVNPDGWQPGIKKSATAAANAKRFNALLKRVPVDPSAKPRTAAAGAGAGDDDNPPF